MCKQVNRILSLTYACIVDLNLAKALMEHIIKFKFFENLATLIGTRAFQKNEILMIVKIVRHIVEINSPLVEGYSSSEVKKMNNLVIQSGLFYQVLAYLKSKIETDSLLLSSIIKVIEIIGGLSFNEFTQAVQEFDFGVIPPKHRGLSKFLSLIAEIKDERMNDNENEEKGFDFMRKKHHRQQLEQEQEEQYLQQDEAI